MALLGVAQTFAVESSSDMVEKLWWEIEGYSSEIKLQPKLWRAFNCAVTSWQISDWLWKERKSAGLVATQLQQFQAALLEQSRVLRMCKHLANASKHGGVDRAFDKSINVQVCANEPLGEVRFEDIGQAKHWKIIVTDADGKQDALDVFQQAYTFWQNELMANPSDPVVKEVQISNTTLRLVLSNDHEVCELIDSLPRLRDATPEQRLNWEPIGHGHGLHWPDLDEDISIRALLGRPT